MPIAGSVGNPTKRRFRTLIGGLSLIDQLTVRSDERNDVPVLDVKTYESAFVKIENAIFIRLSN